MIRLSRHQKLFTILSLSLIYKKVLYNFGVNLIHFVFDFQFLQASKKKSLTGKRRKHKKEKALSLSKTREWVSFKCFLVEEQNYFKLLLIV